MIVAFNKIDKPKSNTVSFYYHNYYNVQALITKILISLFTIVIFKFQIHDYLVFTHRNFHFIIIILNVSHNIIFIQDKIKKDLLTHGIQLKELGGDVDCVSISALKVCLMHSFIFFIYWFV